MIENLEDQSALQIGCTLVCGVRNGFYFIPQAADRLYQVRGADLSI